MLAADKLLLKSNLRQNAIKLKEKVFWFVLHRMIVLVAVIARKKLTQMNILA
jgi:hypothetical protein